MEIEPAEHGRLKVKAEVFDLNGPINDFVYEIRIDNEVVASRSVSGRNKMTIFIPYGYNCALIFKAADYHMKFLMIDTKTECEWLPRRTLYEFDIELYPELLFEGLDTDILDFPCGIVRLDNETGEFDFTSTYNQNIKKEYAALIKQAYQRDRMAARLEDDVPGHPTNKP